MNIRLIGFTPEQEKKFWEGGERMELQQRHFELIASTLSKSRSMLAEDGVTENPTTAGVMNFVATVFAIELGETNEAFDKERFLKAAGVSPTL